MIARDERLIVALDLPTTKQARKRVDIERMKVIDGKGRNIVAKTAPGEPPPALPQRPVSRCWRKKAIVFGHAFLTASRLAPLRPSCWRTKPCPAPS